MSNRELQHRLHYASAKHPIAEVVPDNRWPRMWRVRWPDGSLSGPNQFEPRQGRCIHHGAEGATREGRKASALANGTTWRGPQKPRGASKRTNRPTGHSMLDSLNLTARQRAMIHNAADDVPVAQNERYQKFIADVLRPFREIRDSSVRHAICAGLLRYGSRR